MRWCRYLLLCAAALAFASPAPAGIFNKRNRPNPAQRVPELIQTLRQERDERKRAAAAEELRQYDAQQFPQIVPALIQALQTDPQWGVRHEAAQSLGKLRPVSQPAGQALEKAASDDGSLRVRLQARTSLLFYRLAGYSSREEPQAPPREAPAPITPKTEEPPLAVPAETPPPPLAQPAPTPALNPDIPRPLPTGPDLGTPSP